MGTPTLGCLEARGQVGLGGGQRAMEDQRTGRLALPRKGPT